jgi:hypothetical protein
MSFYKLCIYSFATDIFLTLNTAILEKGDLNYKRSKIFIVYAKKYLIYDLFSIFQLVFFTIDSNFFYYLQ